MTEVFISYAREDIAFVRRLHQALEDQGRKCWVDWEGIPPTAEWITEIKAGIDSAEAFVFVISPDSTASQVCAAELQHAVERNKRIVPIVWRDSETHAVDPRLARLNWIFFRDQDDFDASLEKLLAALDTDLDWVSAHTRLLVRAADWDERGRDNSYALRGRDLADAESWLSRGPMMDPKPNALQTEYILASRKATTKRQRITLAAVAFGAIVAVSLSIVAYFQSVEKARQEKIATANHLINRAEALRDPPPNLSGATDDTLKQSVRAAVQALAHFNDLGIPSADADQTVRKGMALLPRLLSEYKINYKGSIATSAFDSTGRFLAVAQKHGHFVLWDTVEGREIAAWDQELSSMESILKVSISQDRAYLAAITYNASSSDHSSTVTVWRVSDATPVAHFKMEGRVENLALHPKGTQAYAWNGPSTVGLSVADNKKLDDFSDIQLPQALDFSPDGQAIALAFKNRGKRERGVRILHTETSELINQWIEPQYISSLRWTADSKNILIMTWKNVLLRDAATGDLKARYPRFDKGFALSPDGRLVAEGMKSYQVRLQGADSGKEFLRINHPKEVERFALRPNGSSITTLSLGPTIRVWDLGGSRAVAEVANGKPLSDAGFDSSGLFLFTGSEGERRWWQLPDQQKISEPLQQASGEGKSVGRSQYRATVSEESGPNGKEYRVEVLDPAGEKISGLTFSLPVYAAAVTRDGRRVAIAKGKVTRGGWELNLETWDVEKRESIATSPYPKRLPDEYARFLAFSPDDRFIVTASQEGFILWDAQQLTEKAVVYHAGATTIGIQPNGPLVATTGFDRNIRIWNLADGLEVARIEEQNPVTSLALSPDGRWLVTLNEAGVARLWAVQPGDLIAQACARLTPPCP
ncbi:MAG: TIR domain-containing protein [Pseudomonadota bacterium]